VKTWIGFVCVAALAMGPEPRQKTDARLKPVEARYNSSLSLTVDFEQRLLVKGRLPKLESGRLLMLKPRRMRFDYAQPMGKFFLSDGKWAYFFIPSSNRVEKTKLKESEDFRTPLALLLGGLKFGRDFEEITIKAIDDVLEVSALPKNRRFEFEKIVLHIGKDSSIRKILMTQTDNSVMEFTLSNERLNAGVGEALFQFLPPPGATVVEVKLFGVQ
jgi:outer membrane lipoprotein carrier protein